ncbi:hypothetical protein NDK43_03980 [Neobacillus pocheonensis]|uniref:Uncharacterized protein n=1 Tax=Neobacillus pocheonensis TaxID=363869 RepID=A0ABT0W8C5_9BACI|nr:hypothetical protein [Neobacillus pocheonensis]
MKNLKSLSLVVLETVMTDCLMKMENSNNPIYINKQINLFKKVERELINRRDDNHDICSEKRGFHFEGIFSPPAKRTHSK